MHKIKSGIININKPSGITSFDVVKRIRKKIGGRLKVGHAGTLDPNARGVLLILVGEATKISGFLMEQEKEYEAGIVFGVTTDTQDGEGKVLERRECGVSAKDVEKAVNGFKGRQKQVPPMLSAKKHKGQRLYKLFRRGVTVDREPEDIEIKSIFLTSCNIPRAELKVICSKGTYIRTLCHDLGEKLGCGAYMSSLTRTRVGNFRLEDSVACSNDDSFNECMIPLNSVMSGYPFILVGADTADAVRNGRQIQESDVVNLDNIKRKYREDEMPEVFPVFDRDNNLLAMAHAENKSASGSEYVFKLLRVMV